MLKKIIRPALVTLSLLSVSQFCAAGIITAEAYGSGYNDAVVSGSLGGYAMTSFDMTGSNGDNISSLLSPVDNSTVGITTNSNGGNVVIGSADSTSWWTNNTGADYNIFKTHSNRIEIVLPENTLAFAFNIGASFAGNAWFQAFDGSGAQQFDSRYQAPTNGNIEVGGSNDLTPGYGLYAANSSSSQGQCNYISKVVVDPSEGWGVGNFSISQDTAGNCGSTDVPEPGTLAIFGLGLIGLRLARFKKA